MVLIMMHMNLYVVKISLALLKGIPQCSGLGPFIFNIFMNDMIYFMKICDLVNYADDNTLSTISNTVKLVLDALIQDTKNAMELFDKTCMGANPSKFQFMLMKSIASTEVIPAYIEIGDVHIKCERILSFYVLLLMIN